MENVFNIFGSLLEPAIILLILVILLFLNSWIFKKLKSTTTDGNLTKTGISFFQILTAILAFILSLPI
jgi:small conductance mechanosensitive channel